MPAQLALIQISHVITKGPLKGWRVGSIAPGGPNDAGAFTAADTLVFKLWTQAPMDPGFIRTFAAEVQVVISVADLMRFAVPLEDVLISRVCDQLGITWEQE